MHSVAAMRGALALLTVVIIVALFFWLFIQVVHKIIVHVHKSIWIC